ncbi:MAG TPA: hypothetical protein VEG30_16610 [Terriglobales bacterium]|nr:hypothetical protein [Terriglobales bacterium]
MRKAATATILLLAVVACSSFVMAQGISDVYQVNYFSNRLNSVTPGVVSDVGRLDQTVRIINPGEQGTPISAKHGTVCADIYVFDSNQEMSECCACPITANGLLILSVDRDLTDNPLTGWPPPSDGVIKIVSDNQANCDPTSPVPTPDLRAWATHLQNPGGSYLVTTEEEFADAALQQDELSFLGQACSFVLFLGSGKGSCTCGNVE